MYKFLKDDGFISPSCLPVSINWVTHRMHLCAFEWPPMNAPDNPLALCVSSHQNNAQFTFDVFRLHYYQFNIKMVLL